MKHTHKHLLIAGLLATFGLAANAQTPPSPPQGGPMMGRMAQGDPAKMQAHRAERHVRHMGDLKIRLQMTPDQEGAWSAFAAAMQPPAPLVADRAQFRAEMEKLTTPERIDKMLALKTQRDARMNQRASAVKTFYAALTPAQKKAFDLDAPHHGMMGRHGGHGMGMGAGMGPGMGHGMGYGMGGGMGPGMGHGMGMGPGPARN